MPTLIRDKYEARKAEVNARFEQLRANEEELNRIFARIYNMEGEVPIEVEDKYVSVTRIFDTAEEIPDSYKGNEYVRTRRDEIVSLISYAVGCMFGRFSLDKDGLVLANQGDTLENYLAQMPTGPDGAPQVTFMPDKDNVLPITDEEYFEDDIVGRLVEFVRVAYGPETLEENLSYIADALGGKGSAREVIRSYFLKEFFRDHCQTYKKRPIYWLVDSGKKAGFRALIYLHRYTPDLFGIIRTRYVHELQDRYRTRLAHLEAEQKAGAGASVARASKRVADQLAETRGFEEKLHHLADMRIELDLDDGVVVNHAKFPGVLAPVK